MRPLTEDAPFQRWAHGTLGVEQASLGEPLSGGNANVTRRAFLDGRPVVLRHPPAATVSDRAAAGVRREWALLRAIAGRAPVPQPIAFCEDRDVLGAPFLVVDFVDGVSITDELPPAYPAGADTVSKMGMELVDALAAVHRIEPDGVLPDGFGRPDGFVQRQIDRWCDVRARDQVRALPLLDQLADWLRVRIPTDEPATIIHCDYHLDNCLFDPQVPRLAAIIDWEMATLGPPLVDVGLLTMFWQRNPARALGFARIQAVSNRPDVIDAQALAQRWQAATGFSIAHLRFHQVFAFWRLAAIVEGAHVLQVRGAVDSAYARGLAHDVPALLAEAAAVAGIGEGA